LISGLPMMCWIKFEPIKPAPPVTNRFMVFN
jgi:hypothetical protein